MASSNVQQNEVLQEKVTELETKLRNMEAVFVQLEHESSAEPLTERRVRMLKSQLFQLERQMSLMVNARSNDKQRLENSERALHHTHHYLQSLVSQMGSKHSLTIDKSDIKREIEILEDGISQIHSSQESAINKAASELFPKTFLKQKSQPSLSDINNGGLNHINLSHVTKLEQQLAQLYGDISSVLSTGAKSLTDTSDHRKQTEKLMRTLEKTSQDLLELSVLVPSAPWTQRFAMPELTVEDIMKAFPKLTSSKHEVVKSLITCALKLCDHRYYLLKSQNERLEAELNLRQSKDQTVSDYTERISEQFISQFRMYQDDLSNQLIIPLSELLQTFSELSNCPTDEKLKAFLGDFKENLAQFQYTCKAVCSNTDEESIDSGESFTKQLRKMLKKMDLNSSKSRHSYEDRENELQYAERDALDELNYLKLQVLEASTQNSSQHGDRIIKQSPTKLASTSRTTKTPISKNAVTMSRVPESDDNRPRSADVFLTKLNLTQQTENRSPRVSSIVSNGQPNSNKTTPRAAGSEPSWLQEMKQDLNTDSALEPRSNGSVLEPKSDGSATKRPASRTKVVKGVPMAKLNLVRREKR